MKHSSSELFVVTYRHTDGYSFDTGAPEVIFTDRDEAEKSCADANQSAASLAFSKGDCYFVETLVDRLETIRDACRDEGRVGNDR